MRFSKQNQIALALWAADCAEHELSYFDEQYPEDDRPRKAIEAARAWAGGKIQVGEARGAALASHAAAREIDHTASRATARAAGHAAATAHVAGHAPHAAAYAVKAAVAARKNGGATAEREWQYRHLPESLRSAIFPTLEALPQA